MMRSLMLRPSLLRRLHDISVDRAVIGVATKTGCWAKALMRASVFSVDGRVLHVADEDF